MVPFKPEIDLAWRKVSRAERELSGYVRRAVRDPDEEELLWRAVKSARRRLLDSAASVFTDNARYSSGREGSGADWQAE